MKYIVMFAGTTDDQEQWEKMPKDQLEATYARIGKWFEEHTKSGKIVGGEELQPPSTATTIRRKNGKVTVTDGPFIESKEVLGGFAIVDVKDLDEALAIAKSWPGGNLVEVRPIVDHSAEGG
ncbi:MAG: YciI family protein [Candidatus Dormibacteraeota bacterium]|nr:YciI family protein [Candidatus Dormibacteraeota bacterium]